MHPCYCAVPCQVSNFNEWQLKELLALAASGKAPPPAVIQNFMDPLHPDTAVRALCAEAGIAYYSYSSLGFQHSNSSGGGNPVLGSSVIKVIAQKHGVSAARVVLSWALQSGVGVLPRSATPAHISDNATLLRQQCSGADGDGGGDGSLAVLLTAEDMAAIDALGHSAISA